MGVNKNVFDPELYIRPGLSIDEVMEIKELFDLFDVDKTGFIHCNEIKEALLNISLKDQHPGIYRIIARLNITEQQSEAILDKLSFSKFLDLLTERIHDLSSGKITKKEATRLFGLFDLDNSGYISSANLEEIANISGEQLSKGEIMEMIGRADSDGDSLVTVSDFYSILNKSFRTDD